MPFALHLDMCGLVSRDDVQSVHFRSAPNSGDLMKCLDTTVVEERRNSEAKDHELTELRTLVARLSSAVSQPKELAFKEQEKGCMVRVAGQPWEHDGKPGLERALSRTSTVSSEHLSDEIVAELESKLQETRGELMDVKEDQKSMGKKLIEAERHVAELQIELAEELALRREAQKEAAESERQLREFQERMGDPWSSIISPGQVYREVRESSINGDEDNLDFFYSEPQPGQWQSLSSVMAPNVIVTPRDNENPDGLSSGTQSMTMQSPIRSISQTSTSFLAPPSPGSSDVAKITSFLLDRSVQGVVSPECEFIDIHTPDRSPELGHRDCHLSSLQWAIPSQA
mmetsp:Transcript_1983/g.4480  ORF Transcript_1983/g.4480 Transcript_1983/m.4480 type:complete len:342 (+) Transcript_1983:49-1074(+)